MSFSYADQKYNFKRYPATQNRSLRALSAADELLLTELEATGANLSGLVLQHDRFGVLATVLHAHQPQFVATFRSQQKALEQQLSGHKLPPLTQFLHPMQIPEAAGVCLLRIPKSLELFEVYLATFAAMASQFPVDQQPVLLAGFMTRYFTPRLLEIAGCYAEIVEQSKARKKARVLKLSKFKADAPAPESLQHSINYEGTTYQQMAGVFSSGKIDYGTQFLLENLTEEVISELNPTGKKTTILDIACGNGVIGNVLLQRLPATASLVATEDEWLAAESARLNLPADQSVVHWADGLEELPPQSIDLAVTNPPFHFGYETNIEVSLGLFKAATRVLKPEGFLVVVANRHLNYRTHLIKVFREVRLLNSSDKFEILVASGHPEKPEN